MHDAARVIGIVFHAETGQDSLGETRRGPAVVIQAGGARPALVHGPHICQLVRGKTAGASGSAPFAERLDPRPAQRAVPTRGGSTAYPEFSGDLGLRQSRLQ